MEKKDIIKKTTTKTHSFAAKIGRHVFRDLHLANKVTYSSTPPPPLLIESQRQLEAKKGAISYLLGCGDLGKDRGILYSF